MEQFVQEKKRCYDFEAEDSEDKSYDEEFETKKMEIDGHI
jgi:hypothetical protein